MNMTRDFPDLNAKQIPWIIFVLVSNVSALGTAFGYYTRDSGEASGTMCFLRAVNYTMSGS